MWEPSIRDTSTIVSLVSFEAVAVNAMNGVRRRRDRNLCRHENQTLKVACVFVFYFPLEWKKIVLTCKLNEILAS